jgi:hypothetical protein
MVTTVPPLGEAMIPGRKALRVLKWACTLVLRVRSVEDLLNGSPSGGHNCNPSMQDAALLIKIVGLPSCIPSISHKYITMCDEKRA